MKGADGIVRIGALLVLAAPFLPADLGGLLDGKSAATPIAAPGGYEWIAPARGNHAFAYPWLVAPLAALVAAASFGGLRRSGAFTTLCTAWVAVVTLGAIALSPVRGVHPQPTVPGLPPVVLALLPLLGLSIVGGMTFARVGPEAQGRGVRLLMALLVLLEAFAAWRGWRFRALPGSIAAVAGASLLLGGELLPRTTSPPSSGAGRTTPR